MALLADSIRFREPRSHFIVDLVDALESERVKMISRRESFDAPEARVLHASRENDVAVDPVLPNDERGKAHSDLESDPRLLGQDRDWSVLFRDFQQFVENGANIFGLTSKVRRERMPAAGVRLIAIGESAAAIGTTPQRRQPFRRLHAFSCRINPAISTRPHASIARPSSIRQTLNPSTRTFLPVGSMPKKAPRCAPSETQ